MFQITINCATAEAAITMLAKLRGADEPAKDSPKSAEKPATGASTKPTAAEAKPKADPNEVEMPWIWRAVRDKYHANVPSHRSQRLVLRMAPVVVTMPTETVPGLGIAGDF